MDCRAARKRLIPYLDGDLSNPERAAISAHLEACAACRAEVASLSESEAALRSLAICEDPPELTADLHRRLAAATRPAHHHLGRWLVPALAGAAAVVLMLWLWPHSHQPPQRTPMAVQPRTPRPPVQHATVPPASDRPPQTPRLAAGRRVAIARKHRAAPVRVAVRRHPPTTTAKLADMPPPDVAPEPEPVVLLVGDPQPPLPSSSYHVEVTLANGDKSELSRSIERHPSGEPSAVTIAYRNTTR